MASPRSSRASQVKRRESRAIFLPRHLLSLQSIRFPSQLVHSRPHPSSPPELLLVLVQRSGARRNNMADNTIDEPIIPLSLKSAEPDLDVIVGQGDNRRTYRYYSVILASYSEYIDTMLSTPMREQEMKTITFPDIEPRVWEKIMKIFDIGGYKMLNDYDSIIELFPILDEYHFHGAVQTIDQILFDDFSSFNNDGVTFTCGALRRAVEIAAICYDFSLPLSKKEAVKWAEKKLKSMPSTLDEDHIRTLLSLVEEKEEILRVAAATALGKKNVQSKSMDEIKCIVTDNNFAERLKTRSLQIDEQEEVLRHLHIKFCHIETAPPGLHYLVGRYSHHQTYEDAQGAMKHFYHRNYETEDGERRRIIIEAMDPFGEEWHISDVISEEEEVAFANDVSRRLQTNILYKWESSFGSLLPPRYGWVATELGDDPAPTLDYNISTGRGY